MAVFAMSVLRLGLPVPRFALALAHLLMYRYDLQLAIRRSDKPVIGQPCLLSKDVEHEGNTLETQHVISDRTYEHIDKLSIQDGALTGSLVFRF